jgi:hypothetical protein
LPTRAGPVEARVASTAPPRLRINEIGYDAPDVDGNPPTAWIELFNASDTARSLADVRIVIDGGTWSLPDVRVPAWTLYVVRQQSSVDDPSSDGHYMKVRRVELVEGGEVLDALHLPPAPTGTSLARFPNGYGSIHVARAPYTTPGERNRDPGFVTEVAGASAYRPRDSSSNAALFHRGQYWVLGGWSNLAHDVWKSYTDVWRSPDGVHWELVNSSPPYVHYSSFVSWHDRIWAIGPQTFSSEDGAEWRPEPLSAPMLNRAVVFQERLVSVYGSTVVASDDGSRWEVLTETGPWGVREQPGLLVYRGRLWLIGGVSNYRTPDQRIHNDVWSSPDGVHWELVAPESSWAPRHWATFVVHDDKIFMLNGWNPELWPQEYGNTSEIWYSDDGKRWLMLPVESQWEPRHASFAIAGPHGVVVMAGYGTGGVGRMHNDVWHFRPRLYFPKSKGRLADLTTWGRNLDGSGAPPESFADANQVFILRNRYEFEAAPGWRVAGRGTRVIVGDGEPGSRPLLRILGRNTRFGILYLGPDSTTICEGEPPPIRLQAADSRLIVNRGPTE